eukprot:jgi/Mesvir1/8782/Mv02692-RA.1
MHLEKPHDLQALRVEMEEQVSKLKRKHEEDLARVQQELTHEKLARTTLELRVEKANTDKKSKSQQGATPEENAANTVKASNAVDAADAVTAAHAGHDASAVNEHEKGEVDRWLETYSCSALAWKAPLPPPLHWAAQTGRLDVVEHFVKFGLDLNAVDDSGYTPLHLAVENNRLEVVKGLAQAGARLDVCRQSTSFSSHEKDGKGWPALHFAVAKGFVEIVDVLLAAGADVNADVSYVRDCSERALHVATDEGVMKSLLRAPGVQVDAIGPYYDGNGPLTALEKCLKAQRWNLAALLLEAGAKLDASCSDGRAAIEAIVDHMDLVELLLKNKLGVETRQYCLCAAMMKGLVPVAEAVLHAGVGGTKKGYPSAVYLEAALHLAVRANSVSLVEQLLQAGADPDLVPSGDWKGTCFEEPPLVTAVKNGNAEIVKCLVKGGANPNAVGSWHDSKGTCRFTAYPMQGFGGNPSNMEPVVFMAIRSKNLNIVKCLVEEGADVRKPIMMKTTILELARGQPDLIAYLESVGLINAQGVGKVKMM